MPLSLVKWPSRSHWESIYRPSQMLRGIFSLFPAYRRNKWKHTTESTENKEMITITHRYILYKYFSVCRVTCPKLDQCWPTVYAAGSTMVPHRVESVWRGSTISLISIFLLCINKVLQTVQRPRVCSAVYGTVHNKEPLKSDIRK